MRPAVLALGAALLAGGCAGDKLTLLENEDGAETGAVAVINEKRGDEVVVNTALTEAKLSSRPKPRAVKQLNPAYNTLLGSLPPKARGFTITFPVGKSNIPDEQRGILEQLRNELSIRPGAQIEVVGFTDSTGTDKRNDEISKGRALAVVEELRQFGFPVDPEDAIGRGEDDAKAKLGDDVADESYRSVVVVVR